MGNSAGSIRGLGIFVEFPLPRLAARAAATPVGGPTAEAAMSHARYEIDRVAKANNSMRMDGQASEPFEKQLPIISVTVVMSLYGNAS